MDWLQTFISWYFFIFLIGVIFFPLAKRIFSRSPDRGWAFAKTIGIILTSYIMLFGGVARLIPFTREAILVVLCIIAVASYRSVAKKKILYELSKSGSLWKWILIEEILFFAGLLLWTVVRGQEPSIRGLEKFMDFGFMQSINRSQFFPPLDMWYSGVTPDRPNGFFVNYYYFGHLSGALLTKLVGVYPPIGYNLVLATILAQALPMTFSITAQLVLLARIYLGKVVKISTRRVVAFGILGALLLNFAGNTHMLYTFTYGYPTSPKNYVLPPWEVLTQAQVASIYKNPPKGYERSDFVMFSPESLEQKSIKKVWETYILGRNVPGAAPGERHFPDPLAALAARSEYWYPNATRFISPPDPNTIHEFPSYSYVVADLHGHVFDIPFVLLTLGVIVAFVVPILAKKYSWTNEGHRDFDHDTHRTSEITHQMPYEWRNTTLGRFIVKCVKAHVPLTIGLGFMCAIHYMTNAFDGPIYLLLSFLVLFFVHRFSMNFLFNVFVLGFSFLYFSAPFAVFFEPFAAQIGVNCGYPLASLLTGLKDETIVLGKLIFVRGHCQNSPLWQLLMLWGFFWIHALFLGVALLVFRRHTRKHRGYLPIVATDVFVTVLFGFGTLLLIAPEFVYVKDIYPSHFRANTMFKLGYQAYIMMTIASVYTIFRVVYLPRCFGRWIMLGFSTILTVLVLAYIRFAVVSYYGKLQKPIQLDGQLWMKDAYPDSYDIVEYFQTEVEGQPTILEAQGDSYTDYNLISAYTGLPTVAGWWVHQWLWRGSAEIVGKRIPDIEMIYRSDDVQLTRELLRKYKVKYVVVSDTERRRYEVDGKRINEAKFATLGTEVFRSTNGRGAVYKIK